jgi:hypothetical protein
VKKRNRHAPASWRIGSHFAAGSPVLTLLSPPPGLHASLLHLGVTQPSSAAVDNPDTNPPFLFAPMGRVTRKGVNGMSSGYC